jgi:hypothetical protein
VQEPEPAGDAVARSSDTNVADLLRDSPFADDTATAGIQTSVEDVLTSSHPDAAASGGNGERPGAAPSVGVTPSGSSGDDDAESGDEPAANAEES